jgi:two-component system, cell cycle sensor histidine kinase and response regulator CckA
MEVRTDAMEPTPASASAHPPDASAPAAAPGHGGVPSSAVVRILVPTLAIVGAAIAATRFVHGHAVLATLDNLHWTVSYVGAAALAWLGVRYAGADEREPRRWFALGMSAYAIGQMLWDVQVASRWTPFPAPSDACYLLLGALCTWGLVGSLRERTSRGVQAMVALDVGGLLAAVLAFVLALYLPLRGDTSVLQMAVLVLYPVGLLTAACVAVVMVPTLRLRPDRGWVLLLLGLLADGWLWMEWNARSLSGRLDDGSPYNAAFSLAAIAIGLGAMWWRPTPARGAAWERRCEGALRLLPLLLVMVASGAVLVAFTVPGVPPGVRGITTYGAVVVVFIALLRQSILLHERDRLLEAESQFRTLFESSHDAILLMKGERFIDCNPSAALLFGVERERLSTLGPLELSPEVQPDGRTSAESAREHLKAAMDGKSQLFAWRHLRYDGTPFEAEVRLDCVALPGGPIVQAVVRDATARCEAELVRQRLEEQLRHAARLEAVGRLAGGVAHDFNNILTVILGTTELALRRSKDEHTLKDLGEIRRSAQRAAALTSQLLAFSRKQVIAPVPSNLNVLVSSDMDMLRRLIGEDVELSFHPGRDVGTILVDPTQVEQVLVNLVVNARDAMPGGGRVRIETSVVELDEEACRSRAEAHPGRFVRLEVRDNGPGIAAEVIGHVFEPFFTTKAFGRGTGLGLSTVYGIVRQSDGFIELESGQGEGACFHIHFPEIEAAAQRAPAPVSPALRPGHEHILLVEDERIVRDLAKRVLAGLGYEVTAAASGNDALAALADPALHVDLLLTDVIMPSMSGRELYERLSRERPGLPVIYMSGYTDHIIAPHGVLDPGTHFIQKPFTLETLAGAVRSVLDCGEGDAGAGRRAS